MNLSDLPSYELRRPGKGLLLADGAGRDFPRLILWATTEGAPSAAEVEDLLDVEPDDVEAVLYVNGELRLLNDSRFHDTPEVRSAVAAALAEMGLDLPFAEPPPEGPWRFA